MSAKTPPIDDPQKRSSDCGGSAAVFRVASRIFRLNDAWYFSSREGEQGPFQSESVAKKELETYIKLLVSPDVEEKGAPANGSTASGENPSASDIDKQVWDQYDLLN